MDFGSAWRLRVKYNSLFAFLLLNDHFQWWKLGEGCISFQICLVRTRVHRHVQIKIYPIFTILCTHCHRGRREHWANFPKVPSKYNSYGSANCSEWARLTFYPRKLLRRFFFAPSESKYPVKHFHLQLDTNAIFIPSFSAKDSTICP